MNKVLTNGVFGRKERKLRKEAWDKDAFSFVWLKRKWKKSLTFI